MQQAETTPNGMKYISARTETGVGRGESAAVWLGNPGWATHSKCVAFLHFVSAVKAKTEVAFVFLCVWLGEAYEGGSMRSEESVGGC